MTTPFELPVREEGGNVLLCVTGSVAAIRRGKLHRCLSALGCVGNVVIIETESVKHFEADPPLSCDAIVLHDSADWHSWQKLGDPVAHIELRNWADVLCLAPLSANTLAKVAHGLCDNLVTCVARAWPVREKPFIVAPAMNTAMWTHPLTGEQIARLQRSDFGVTVVPPVEKTLACGDTGMGAMASPEIVAAAVEECMLRRFTS